MYLHNAADLDGVITFGINPLIEFLDIFEEEFMDGDNPDSKESIFWNEINGKAFMIRETAKRIEKADLARSRLEKDNPGKL
jgi:hypothetical protein